MKTKISFFIILLLLFFLINNCQYFELLSYKEWKDNSGDNDVDIYIGGYYMIGSDLYACYWKNNELVPLGSGNITAIYLDGNDIYCGGFYSNSSVDNAFYCKNEVRVSVELDDTGNASRIYSIAAAGGVVFACGYETIGAITVSCYWINGKKYSLNNLGTGNSRANSIIIDNDTLDFYIAGYYTDGYQKACYWINGNECITLPVPNYTNPAYEAISVTLSNGKLYFCGDCDHASVYDCLPCYWIDGEFVELQPGNTDAVVNDIKIYNGTVYCIGDELIGFANTYPTLWKDNSIVWSDTSATNGRKFTVYNGDIYATGYYDSNQYPCYWKNGNRTTLNYPSSPSHGSCIAVKPKM